MTRLPILKTSDLFASLDSIKKDLKGDAYYESQIIQVEGDLYKLDKNYNQADKSYSAAAKAFTDNRYLSEIGICWYKAAQALFLRRRPHHHRQPRLSAQGQPAYFR